MALEKSKSPPRSESFRLILEGPSISKEGVPVTDLVFTLSALGRLIGSTNEKFNAGVAGASINLKATNKGSVDILVNVIHTFSINDIQILAGGMVDIPSVFRIVTDTIGVLKFLAENYIRKPNITINGDYANIVHGDQNIKFHPRVRNVYLDKDIRQSVEDFINPMTKEGISNIKIIDKKGDKVADINHTDKQFFQYSKQEDIQKNTTTINMDLVIETLSFNKGKKWSLKDANGNIYRALIKDEVFLDKVAKQEEKFIRGDKMACEMEIETITDSDNTQKHQYSVVRVKNHQHIGQGLII